MDNIEYLKRDIDYLKSKGYVDLMCDIEAEYPNLTPRGRAIMNSLTLGFRVEYDEANHFRDCYNNCLEDIICKIEEMKCEGEL